MRYRPKNMDDVKICLGDCPDDTKVDVQRGVSLVTYTVADLRSQSAWPPDLVLEVHKDPDSRFTAVKVERA